ncbi:MAG: hypothetical protein A2508_10150 [Candidatus Lambdaproteobacteria bacterium RIFOXYD12_FULL_49_8]|uniref:Transcriptional regulator n=1 Tax=Candidatus Lambdaproteobacteria bacterium RIFOXYD2_FULL_50_16 TaxID=1817772 RepID=A0A1F6GBE6_9PROT|nr:MAG: hypothetical protein A2527_04860 [Candidatus Lambdaproteobacteria bacterium RIFOXYD2_FULL_50_16]OGG97899.1 MAG: hypothetical protein A2508_10150 [Candidatus Lambdaproteobacteria bacterium RIFOXYD12_FULL_49_8]
MFPNHQDQLKRLNKIEGQIKGIARMIEERRYCVDILTQIKAAKSALEQIELGVLEGHLRHCVNDAAQAEGGEFEQKIEEIMKLISYPR